MGSKGGATVVREHSISGGENDAIVVSVVVNGRQSIENMMFKTHKGRSQEAGHFIAAWRKLLSSGQSIIIRDGIFPKWH